MNQSDLDTNPDKDWKLHLCCHHSHCFRYTSNAQVCKLCFYIKIDSCRKHSTT